MTTTNFGRGGRWGRCAAIDVRSATGRVQTRLLMATKLTQPGRLGRRRSGPRIPHQPRQEECNRDYARRAEKRHAGAIHLVGEAGKDGSEYARHSSERLLHAEHQAELVAIRVMADERRIGGEQ